MQSLHVIFFVGNDIQTGTDISNFLCASGENVTLDKLCDGNSDCEDGGDETTPLCESNTVFV